MAAHLPKQLDVALWVLTQPVAMRRSSFAVKADAAAPHPGQRSRERFSADSVQFGADIAQLPWHDSGMPAQRQNKKRRKQSRRRKHEIDAARSRRAAIDRERDRLRWIQTYPVPTSGLRFPDWRPPEHERPDVATGTPWQESLLGNASDTRLRGHLDSVALTEMRSSLSRLRLHSLTDYQDHYGYALREKFFRDQVCVACGAQDVQAHHCSYARLGDELAEDLVALCDVCHETVHLLVRAGRAMVLEAHLQLEIERDRRAPGKRGHRERRRAVKALRDELRGETDVSQTVPRPPSLADVPSTDRRFGVYPSDAAFAPRR